MTVEIRETRVEESEDATIVSLVVSDTPPSDEKPPSFRLDLVATLPRFAAPLLIHLQREAIGEAVKVLSQLHDALLQQIPMGVSSRPLPKP